MSAIFGLVHLDKRPVAPEDLTCMDAALAMYGTDGGGLWRNGAVGLGQRLLHLTPEDAFEQQPQISADGQVYLVADGRIYNRPELIEELRLDVAATVLPDSAIILSAYQRWGNECVHHLIGAFTFALWDARLSQLLVVRSAITSPSLFFYTMPRTFAFATMPKGLFALPFISRSLDEPYLAAYLARISSEPTTTFYTNVKRLLPGQMLLVQIEKAAETWTVETFWQPDLTRQIHFARDEEYVEAFCALFKRVVQDHLRSQTPVGVMMSGGLDSTAVAAFAAQRYCSAGKRLATFTEVPPPGFDGALISGRYADETPYVQAMAQRYTNLDLNLVQTDGQIYLDDINSLFAAAETPFPNASNRVWYEAILQKAQAQGVRVLLTGAGGNLTISWRGDGRLAELVGAGRWAQAWQEAQALTQRGQGRSPLQNFLMRGILPHVPDWSYLLFDRLRSLDPNRGELVVDWRRHTPIRSDFALAHRIDERARANKIHLRNRLKPDMRAIRLRSLISAVWRGDGLAAGNQARYGVTTCAPTHDVRLVEFCLALPEDQFQRNGTTRWLIQRAMTEHLPPAVLGNKLRGLQAADWYTRLYHARERILDELTRIEQCDLARRALDVPRLRRMVEEMKSTTNSAREQMTDYRGVLERGLMTGSFIRWVEGGG